MIADIETLTPATAVRAAAERQLRLIIQAMPGKIRLRRLLAPIRNASARYRR